MNVLIIDDSLSACRSVGRILMDEATTICCIKNLNVGMTAALTKLQEGVI